MKRPEKSTIYGILYLALIPSFAAAYSLLLPNAFYQSSISYERNLQEDYRRLEEAFGDWLVQNQSRRVQGWAVIGAHSVEIQKINDRQREVKFSMEVEVAEPGKGNVTIGQSMAASYWDHRKGRPAVAQISTEGWVVRIGAREYADHTISLLECDSDRCELEMPGHLADLLENYRLVQAGFPSQASGNFERMLYLSAVTATTVGYGDIVPITRASRLLVAFEAVLEIVVVGLFLNALATKRGAESSAARDRDRPPPPSRRE